MNLEQIKQALRDSDDLVEACRADNVIILTKQEGERIIVVKHDALAAALEMIDEWEQSFELYDNAMRRGTKMWQNASGNPNKVWPDGAKLIAWLMDKLERFESIDPGALRMAANELPDTAEPRRAHLRRIATLVEGK